MPEAIEIDGSLGEGGGQVLRTALGLAAILGKEVLLENIRANRPKPGLRPQHLAAVKTLASACGAELRGAAIGSVQLSFKPKKVSPSNLNVNIGTAGSIPLLLSQMLPASLLQETKLHVFGGTNVPFSPPIEFMQEALFPAIHKIGARPYLKQGRRGYFPKGRGSASFSSKQAVLPLKPIKITELGRIEFVKIYSHCASLPRAVAESQAAAARHELDGLSLEFEETIECREQSESIGSGITLFAFTVKGSVLSGSALGAKGVPAEKAGQEAAQKLLSELNAGMPCDSHLADQMIPFMALARGKSEIHSTCLTSHCLTNIAVVEKILPVKFSVEGLQGKPAKISVEGISFRKE